MSDQNAAVDVGAGVGLMMGIIIAVLVVLGWLFFFGWPFERMPADAQSISPPAQPGSPLPAQPAR